MEIFNNQQRSGYEEVKSYGPSWWPQFREMDAVYRLSGWTLDLMAYWLDQIILNLFVGYCDETTLKALENLLGIEYSWDAGLDERRRTVAAYMYGTGKLSKSTILSIVKAYTGCEGDCYWDGGTLIVQFNNDDNVDVYIAMLQKILERRMPAHLQFSTRCMCTVFLGITPATEAWKKSFTLAGTVPGVSTGLSIADVDIEFQTAANGLKTAYPMSGASGNAGTYPTTSTGLEIASNSGLLEVNTESYSVLYKMCGDDSGL